MSNGYSDVLIGLQYGDEGKAKIIDTLAPNYNIVARFNGGMNAGHTIVTDKGTLALRQIPSAVSYDHCTLYIGSGCVISPKALCEEISSIANAGFDISDRLKISPHSTLVLPHHIILDRLHGEEVGTTGNGIGPAYADRAFRIKSGNICNVRMEMLVKNPNEVIRIANFHLNEISNCTEELREFGAELIKQLEASLQQLTKFVATSNTYLVDRVTAGDTVLFEGAQSYMLDVVHGDVPYVTSSHTSVSAAYSGGDLPPKYHRHSFGVVKLVMSRVGKGPFPSEFGGDISNEYCTKDSGKAHTRDYENNNFNPDELMATGDPFRIGQALRMYSGEYGTGSGRPRRIGMLDLAQLRNAVLLNGIDSLFLTKCDCLRDFDKTPSAEIPVVIDYDISGDPKIKTYESFTLDISQLKYFEQLPTPLQELVSDIADISGAKVIGLGVGPHRSQLILRELSGTPVVNIPKFKDVSDEVNLKSQIVV